MKKGWQSLFLTALMMISLTGCENINSVTNTVGEKLGLTDSTETETELQDGQRKATIQVVSITGNELTYTELEEETEAESETETETEAETGEETDAEGASESGTEAEAGEETDAEEASEPGTEAEAREDADVEPASESISIEEGSAEDASEADTEDEIAAAGGMPDMGDFSGGEMPDMSEDSSTSDSDSTQGGRGQRGGGMDMENMGDMDMSDMSDMAEAFSSGDLDMSEIADVVSSMDNAEDLQDLVSSLTQETTTVYLQVGVVVHTDTGKEKTFSILEAGDELEVLFETDEDGNEVITEMWLTGTE